MKLLWKYITQEHPEDRVSIIKSWPIRPHSSLSERFQAQLSGFPDEEIPGIHYLLFDEGQSTYWDETLWVIFKDEVQDPAAGMKRPRVVLFCSCDNKKFMSRFRSIPPQIPEDARVTLKGTGPSQLRLLLNRNDFNDIVACYPKPIQFDAGLLDFIYDFTGGHVGAIQVTLDFIMPLHALGRNRMFIIIHA